MPYKITIEMIKELTITMPGDKFEKELRPYTPEEVERMSYYDQEKMKDPNTIHLKTIYERLPDKEQIRTNEVKIYEQLVAELDLNAVIKAINGL